MRIRYDHRQCIIRRCPQFHGHIDTCEYKYSKQYNARSHIQHKIRKHELTSKADLWKMIVHPCLLHDKGHEIIRIPDQEHIENRTESDLLLVPPENDDEHLRINDRLKITKRKTKLCRKCKIGHGTWIRPPGQPIQPVYTEPHHTYGKEAEHNPTDDMRFLIHILKKFFHSAPILSFSCALSNAFSPIFNIRSSRTANMISIE